LLRNAAYLLSNFASGQVKNLALKLFPHSRHLAALWCRRQLHIAHCGFFL
jgi:hypothetical protein